MLTIRLWLVLLGLMLWPGLALAQSPISRPLSPQAKVGDVELSQATGHMLEKPKSFQEKQLNLMNLWMWDELQKAKNNGLSGPGSEVTLTLTGSRP